VEGGVDDPVLTRHGATLAEGPLELVAPDVPVVQTDGVTDPTTGELPHVRRAEPLARHTTLELGGPSPYFVDAPDTASILDVLRWADARGLPVRVLGGGSNVVVADEGVDGVVLRVRIHGVSVCAMGGAVVAEVGAGEGWDAFVEHAVSRGWAGVECLAGIPGTVGATPIQNVGAYGQEVAEVVDSVTVIDRESLVAQRLPAEACGFGYRTSRFRRRPGREIVTAVSFRLRPGGPATVRYRELDELVAARRVPPDLATVRSAVMELRRHKSMVIDEGDPNRRSVGSFFVNPILEAGEAERLAGRAVTLDAARTADEVPRFVLGDGRVKVPAAWLIEASGFRKGERRGSVGLSSAHALALVHHGDGSTRELLEFAADIRTAVRSRFGVVLEPEPVIWGYEGRDPLEGQSAL
jgi:UDP-N-acetylmuramate dehydrogenase